MNEIEFLNYTETPEEKYFMGIATVRLYGSIILKYKVIEKKDRSGFFIAAPTFRLPVGNEGELKYVDAIMLDSRMEHDELMTIMRTGINQALHNTQPKEQQQQTQEKPQQNLDSFPF